MSKARLLKFLEWHNVADHMDDARKSEICERVFQGLEEDKNSIKEWRAMADKVMDLAIMKSERKDDPWPNAANVKFPLISTAMLQFSSRTLPEFIKGGEVAKYRVLGLDPELRKQRKGTRNKMHINHQILNKMEDWEDGRERLFNQLSVIGTCFVKTYYDEIDRINKSELIPYDLITINDYITSLSKAPRITEHFYLSKKDVTERIRKGLYSDVDLDLLEMDSQPFDRTNLEFIEQHCWEDLDEDGIEEPYIVVAHVSSRTLMRMVPRFREEHIEEDDIYGKNTGRVTKIRAIDMFTDYHFIHSPNGRFHGFGFGTLLFNTSNMVDSVLNQLIDAGTLANTQSGFITKNAKLRNTRNFITPGKLNEISITNGSKVSDNIEMLQFKEPSQVLYQLLGLLVDAAKTFTSTTEALTGTADAQNASPNTVLALIQQGLMVFNAIRGRVLRGFEKELKKLITLNSRNVNVDEYIKLLDIPEFITVMDPQTGQPVKQKNPEFQEMFDPVTEEFIDYDLESIDIVPVADLNTATEQEKLIRTQAMMQYAQQLGPFNVLNLRELSKEAFRALGENHPEKFILPEPPPPDPSKDPNIIALQAELDKNAKTLMLKDREITVKEKDLEIKAMEMQAKIKNLMTQSIKALADAEATNAGAQLDVYKHQLERLNSSVDSFVQIQGVKNDSEKTQADVQAKKEKDLPETPPGFTPDVLVQEARRRGWSIDDGR